MKTLFTLAFGFFTFINSQALSVVLSGFNGSVLCGNIESTCEVPDTLQIGYDYTTRVLVDEEKKTVTITHFFTELITKPVSIPLQSITTDLTTAFSNVEHFDYEATSWTFSQNIQLNNNTLPITTGYGDPFRRCYEYKYDCESIIIYVKELRSICPTNTIKFTTRQSVSNDSIFFTPYFEFTPNEIICDAVGNTIVTDSTQIYTHTVSLTGKPSFNLETKNYNLFKTDSIDIFCIVEPCPSPLILTEKLGNVNYASCPLNLNNSGPFKGSAFCDNLSIVHELPNNLPIVYLDRYEIEQSTNKDSLFINYYLTTSSTPTTGLDKLEIPLTDYFIETGFLTFPTVQIIQSVTLNEDLILTDTTQGNPFNQCYDYIADCNGITILRKSLRSVCPAFTIKTKTTSAIQNNVVMGNFIDSLIPQPFVCFAAGFGKHVDSIKIEISNAEIYRVYIGKDINCVDNVCNTMDLAPIYLGEADLNDCIINGLNATSPQNYIHPNPATNKLYLPAYKGTRKVDIFSITGNHLLSIDSHNHNDLQIDHLPTGYYILIIEDETTKTSYNFMKD